MRGQGTHWFYTKGESVLNFTLVFQDTQSPTKCDCEVKGEKYGKEERKQLQLYATTV